MLVKSMEHITISAYLIYDPVLIVLYAFIFKNSLIVLCYTANGTTSKGGFVGIVLASTLYRLILFPLVLQVGEIVGPGLALWLELK